MREKEKKKQIQCPAGKYCSLRDANGNVPSTVVELGTCPSDTFSVQGQFDCSPCPQGYSCQNGLLSAACNEGEFSGVGSSQCSAAECSGTVCNGIDLPHGCPVGYKIDANLCVRDTESRNVSLFSRQNFESEP